MEYSNLKVGYFAVSSASFVERIEQAVPLLGAVPQIGCLEGNILGGALTHESLIRRGQKQYLIGKQCLPKKTFLRGYEILRG